MSITLEIQDDPEPPFEHCCFCDKPTRYWTVLKDRTPGAQVACCPSCGSSKDPKDVPTKDDWFEAEKVRHPRLVRGFVKGYSRGYP